MDVGITIKPPAVVATTTVRADVAPAGSRSVQTELRADQAVTPAGDGEAIRYDLSDSARRLQAAADALRQAVERNLETDPRTRELVLKVVNRQTGQVVDQIPDENQLRLRAYIRTLTSKNSPAPGEKVEKTA